MLVWRLIYGALFIAVLVLLVWLDSVASRPGLALLPLALLLCVAATQELAALLNAHAAVSIRRCWQGASSLTVLLAGVPLLWSNQNPSSRIGSLGWLAIGITAGLGVVLCSELRRFQPDRENADYLAKGVLAVVYIGAGIGWMVQLRIGPLDTGPADRWGMLSLVSLVAIVKAGDMGAYAAGHAVGRHKLAPTISPGKTWEGLVGGILMSGVAAGLTLAWVPSWLGLGALPFGPGWLVYALLLSVAGLAGDLAASVLKRSAGVKDSSGWLPGLGGVVDVCDSLLPAAPVAYLCWWTGLVGP